KTRGPDRERSGPLFIAEIDVESGLLGDHGGIEVVGPDFVVRVVVCANRVLAALRTGVPEGGRPPPDRRAAGGQVGLERFERRAAPTGKEIRLPLVIELDLDGLDR